MEYLAHYGIKGQKWGIRRYQNEDGSYTPAGKERYKYPDRKLDNTEKYITRKMDKSAAKSEMYGAKAEERQNKTNKDSGLLYNYYQRKGEKYFNRLNAGSDLLKSYRSMSLDSKRTIDKGKNFFSLVPDDFTIETAKAKSVYDKYVSDTLPSDYAERRKAIKEYAKAARWY